MPLYEYSCSRCGKKFEVIQKFSDEPLSVHEGCGGEVERLISPPAFHFKGTGWYVTDYAHGKQTANGSNGKSHAAPEQPAKKADPAPESKPKPATAPAPGK